jgi:hypothetical protein
MLEISQQNNRIFIYYFDATTVCTVMVYEGGIYLLYYYCVQLNLFEIIFVYLQ